jgi:hypothetical protein
MFYNIDTRALRPAEPGPPKCGNVSSPVETSLATGNNESEPDFRTQLEKLHPSATFLVELPFAGNGNLYQVRTTIFDEVFFGRAVTEEEAVSRCCKKAAKFILQQREDSDRNGNNKASFFFFFFFFQTELFSWSTTLLD